MLHDVATQEVELLPLTAFRVCKPRIVRGSREPIAGQFDLSAYHTIHYTVSLKRVGMYDYIYITLVRNYRKSNQTSRSLHSVSKIRAEGFSVLRDSVLFTTLLINSQLFSLRTARGGHL